MSAVVNNQVAQNAPLFKFLGSFMKFLYILITGLLLCGCTSEAIYNQNAEIAPVDDSLQIDKTLQKTFIYVDSEDFLNQNIAPSSHLGNDKSLDINLGKFASGASARFFKNYLTNISETTNQDVLNSNNLIIMPKITNFTYGFYSPDGIDVSAKPYVSYNLNLKIFKNQKLIYNKNISSNEKNYGEEQFFGSGDGLIDEIAPIFQKAIANDFNLHAIELIDTINLAK
ncbi:hypothetical protein [Campylobacter hominis]